MRVRLEIPSCYQHEPIISRLISDYGLVVHITGANLAELPPSCGCFDLELRGTVHQITQSLAYLESLDVTIIGKAGTAGDSWFY